LISSFRKFPIGIYGRGGEGVGEKGMDEVELVNRNQVRVPLYLTEEKSGVLYLLAFEIPYLIKNIAPRKKGG